MLSICEVIENLDSKFKIFSLKKVGSGNKRECQAFSFILQQANYTSHRSFSETILPSVQRLEGFMLFVHSRCSLLVH